ncbi:hypothetical protein [Priestia aryabhattai]|uniref:hypothetical protein n=1 Tax=Priestia aryabhattai TaxID=412384 RepID=UPI000BF06627|nr:hypothetical protein [Priestia aryabhattai]PEI56595.1 hypothetical protein CN635_16630 [Priestia aryabhattai]
MNGTDWINALMKALGYGGVAASLIYFVARNILKPSFDKYLNFRLEKAKIEEQSRFTIAEMHEQAKISFNDKIHTTRLEMETVKLNRVLPILEELNKHIVKHKMIYSTYINSILNKGTFRKDFEKERLEIDGNVINLINQVAIYLPKEMRTILNSIRVVISVSWKEPNTLHNIINQDGLKHTDVGRKTLAIYNSYTECFYEMVNTYCEIQSKETSYSDILLKYNFDENGIYSENDILTRYVKAYILLHEYTSSKDYDNLMEEIKHIKD